jgi:hypothetical protein
MNDWERIQAEKRIGGGAGINQPAPGTNLPRITLRELFNELEDKTYYTTRS